MQDLKFPYDNEMIKDRLAVSDWLIGAAVRFEYGDNGKSNFIFNQNESKLFVVDKYKSVLSNVTNDQQKTNSSNQTGNPLDTIDCK